MFKKYIFIGVDLLLFQTKLQELLHGNKDTFQNSSCPAPSQIRPRKWNALWSLGSVVTFSSLMFCLLQTLVQKITDTLELFFLLFQVSEKPNNLKFQR